MNCVERSRRCVGKKVKNREEEVYIVNLVARLTVLYCALSRFGRNSADLAEFNRDGRLRQIAVELVADCGGTYDRLWWRQVESRWRVCKVSRRCPVTLTQYPYSKYSILSNYYMSNCVFIGLSLFINTL